MCKCVRFPVDEFRMGPVKSGILVLN
eukprot:COSAG02_NODE_41015_length_399_cov_0.686667_1_plen_25_part_10